MISIFCIRYFAFDILRLDILFFDILSGARLGHISGKRLGWAARFCRPGLLAEFLLSHWRLLNSDELCGFLLSSSELPAYGWRPSSAELDLSLAFV